MTQFKIAAAMLALLFSAPLTAAAQTGVVDPSSPSISQTTRHLTGIRASVAADLRHYGFGDTDPRRLSASQLAAIHHLAHSGRSDSEIRGHISATLRRGFLQRGLERLLR